MITGTVDPVTRDGARAAARHELSKGIYHHDDLPWPVRVFNWLWDELSKFTARIGVHGPGGGVVALVIVIVVVALIIFAWWRLGPVQRNRRLHGAVLTDPSVTAADHLRAALAAAAAGDWAAAVLERMRALAQLLEENGTLDPRPGRTADELAAEVAVVRPAAADVMRAAARTFDDVVYGGREATAESYATVVGAAEAIASRAVVGSSA